MSLRLDKSQTREEYKVYESRDSSGEIIDIWLPKFNWYLQIWHLTEFNIAWFMEMHFLSDSLHQTQIDIS